MELTLGRRVGGPAAAVVVVALVCVGVAYFAGLIQTLGYEQRHVTFSGFASGTSAGGGLGLKDMLFFEGQTVFVDYEVEIREGSLRIGVLDTFGPIGDKPHFVESIAKSGSGEVAYAIPKTGIYSIYFDGSVLGNGQGRGYDLSYSVTWGVR